MIKPARFQNEFIRKEHYEKHVIQNKETFPRVLKSPIEYENSANDDIQNFTLFSISESHSKTHRIGFMRLLPSSNTFAVTNNQGIPTLITYYVPVSTFIPEFIYFSYFNFRMKQAIYNFDPFQILPIGKAFSLELVDRWSSSILEDFRTEYSNKKDIVSNLKRTLFFLKRRDSLMVKSDYNITHVKIMKFLKMTFIDKRISSGFDIVYFASEIKEKILYCNKQLNLLQSEDILTSGALIVFSLAYYVWIYTTLLDVPLFTIDCIKAQQIMKLYENYLKVFEEAFKEG
jgi:hypothetical protein